MQRRGRNREVGGTGCAELKPLAIDLFAGLGGWTDGLLAEGYFVVGFDIERHEYGGMKYPGHLVIQDVLTLHGSQFRDAALIVCSPPCQEFSWMAMPWTRAKAHAAMIRADETGAERERLTRLFDACFRIQREACEAAGRHIPMVVENVCGAQPWVGEARANFGSYYLWGDVPVPQLRLFGNGSRQRLRFPRTSAKLDGYKSSGMNWSDQTKRGQDFTRIAGRHAMAGIKGIPHRTNGHWTNHAEHEGIKHGGTWWHDEGSISRTSSSKSPARKAASAMIAKIPLQLSRHIAATYFPHEQDARNG